MVPQKNTRTRTSTSRRTFLKNSAVATAALAAPLPILRSAHAAGSDVIKIGLVGCGGRGAGAVDSALRVEPSAQLTAMADAFIDRTKDRRNALKAKHGERIAVSDDDCYGGFDAYQKLLDSGVDVAILAETPHFRPIHLQACVDAGVHVFAEKPMAVDAPGVRSVLAAGQQAKRKNLSFVSGFETRYSTSSREVVQRIRDGAIGDIVNFQTTYNTGPLWHRGRKPEWTEMEFQLRNWYYFTWLSGDHLVEQHVHYNDLVCWMMGDEPPLHAWGYGGRAERTEAKYGDIFDHHAVVYEYPNGVRHFAYTRQQRGCYNENSKIVFGTKARMVSHRGWSMQDAAGNTLWEPEKDARHPELNCFEEMFAAMRAGTPINNSLSMAHSTMHAILGRMATYSGQRINWDDAFASDLKLAPSEYAMDADPPVLPDEDGKYPFAIPGANNIAVL